jgi:hypothetical protein
MRRIASLILVFSIALVFLITPMQAAQVPPDQSAAPEGGDSVVFPDGWPTDAQSTTGPIPPEWIDRGDQVDLAPEVQVVISGVPAYIWHNGCGPTAAGMVIGYWDGQGYGDLVPGSASTQTAAVDNMISSSGNYNDYCLPIDSPPNLLDDKSEPPFGDEHPDDSVADLMKTSQSYWDNYYGWSWYSHMDDALQGYVPMVAPHYTATAVNQPWGTFTWNSFRAEIDAGRPVVLLVDTDGDGNTDHFVTAYGYRDDGGTLQYACRDTWDTGIHWYNFVQMASGRPWGIYGATTFQISGSVAPGPLVYNSRTIDDDTLGNSSGDGDGIADCGEDIELYVSLRNQGSATATGVNATMSTSDPYVSFLYNMSSGYPDISGGGIGTNSDDFDIRVSPTTPHSHMIHFNLNVTASNGGPWSTSFDVPVSCGEYTVHLPLAGKTFILGFESDFDGTARRWETHSGSWWIDSDAWFTTTGVSGAWASASYVATYGNFDYEARLWRTGCDGCSHGIMVRGTPYPLGSGYRWNNGYGFYINRDGTYAIFKYTNGSYTALKSWTTSSAINEGNAWNELRVVASGSNLYFYINDTFVWAGSDSSHSWGRVGITMARDTSSSNQLWADWAELTPLSTTFLAGEVDAEQQALNEAANEAGDTSLDWMSPED